MTGTDGVFDGFEMVIDKLNWADTARKSAAQAATYRTRSLVEGIMEFVKQGRFADARILTAELDRRLAAGESEVRYIEESIKVVQ